VVENGGRFLRVQVKSTTIRPGNHYVCQVGQGRQKSYSGDEIDFLVVHIVPIDTWYVIPIEVVCRLKKGIGLSPHNSLSKHAVYMEAWHLLQGESAGAAGTLSQSARAEKNSSKMRKPR
jgi:hypothetical protein